jgi:hypothetical protein
MEMDIEALRRRLARVGRQGTLYGAVLGFVAGLLVAALVLPDRSVTTVSGPGGARAAGELGGAGGASDDEGVFGDGGGPGTAGRTARERATASGGTDDTVPGRGGTQGRGGARNVRGVSDDKIRLGVAVPDYDALRALGENYDTGDPVTMWKALYAKWKREGRVPVHGRDVELVFSRPYNIFSDAEKRATCVELVQDKQVFVVGQTALFGVGQECVAREYSTPMVGTDGVPEEMMTRSLPYLFTLQLTDSSVRRNWVQWAHERGALRGKTIGLYSPGQAAVRRDIERNVKARLERLGYRVAEDFVAPGDGGGAEDAVAVQRFRSAGVDLAMVMTAPLFRSNFLRQAEAQRYRPTYIDNDLNFATGDSATQTYPPEQWDKMYAITGLRVGDHTPERQSLECVENYERYSGDRVYRPGKGPSAKWTNATNVCDIGNTILEGLHRAGRDLNPDSFVAGMETIRQMPMARNADVTFTRDKHTGADRQRTLQWHADCRCWKVAGSWGPFFVR